MIAMRRFLGNVAFCTTEPVMELHARSSMAGERLAEHSAVRTVETVEISVVLTSVWSSTRYFLVGSEFLAGDLDRITIRDAPIDERNDSRMIPPPHRMIPADR